MRVEDVLRTVKQAVAIYEASKEVVVAVQTALKALGLYDDTVDGLAGKNTRKALNDFKDKEFLGRPDMLGETTAEALIEAYSERKTPQDVSNSRISPTPFAHIPGISQRVSTASLILPVGHFTWGEATKGLTRLPDSALVTTNIIKVAKVLEEVRELFGGKPIIVTSWYRPAKINKAVGGVSNSRHILGDAVDFQVKGVHPTEVQKKLDSWYGSRGGLASATTFTHIDTRGYKARWRYN